MLTPREKSPLPKMSPEEDRTRDAVDSEPKHYQLSYSGPFPLELTWVLTPFSQNSFGGEYQPRSGLCTHSFHRTDFKDPDVHVLGG